MKRSNRLVLLVGIFLAIVVFFLIYVWISGDGGGTGREPEATTVAVVVAATDLDLGDVITAEAVTTKDIPITEQPGDSYTDESFVIGKIARSTVTSGQLIDSTVLSGDSGAINNIEVPAGFVAISMMVDQVTGVGTVVKPGDYVDLVTAITGIEKIPLVEAQVEEGRGNNATPAPNPYVPVALPYNTTTVKTLVQGAQVLGTLLPPPPASNGQATPAPEGDAGGATTTLNGQQQIVVVAVTLQDAEVIKFNQVDGNISLVLRSSEDCKAPDESASPSPSPCGLLQPSASPVTACPVLVTTGITLRRLVDDRGVLPPTVVQVIQPTPYPQP